eukprot:TRINITY_DN70529_c0_g1_i1.p1 TRINITY_DN70529_c0_g1~~TRINITY_DN70529_c0_g1_i1.p1  ORF type:complete len:290 (+),score=24.33 TRINITY_DN70529_c0_g1_i1:38-907(+)
MECFGCFASCGSCNSCGRCCDSDDPKCFDRCFWGVWTALSTCFVVIGIGIGTWGILLFTGDVLVAQCTCIGTHEEYRDCDSTRHRSHDEKVLMHHPNHSKVTVQRRRSYGSCSECVVEVEVEHNGDTWDAEMNSASGLTVGGCDSCRYDEPRTCYLSEYDKDTAYKTKKDLRTGAVLMIIFSVIWTAITCCFACVGWWFVAVRGCVLRTRKHNNTYVGRVVSNEAMGLEGFTPTPVTMDGVVGVPLEQVPHSGEYAPSPTPIATPPAKELPVDSQSNLNEKEPPSPLQN